MTAERTIRYVLYDAVKQNDGIGMPLFRMEDGTDTLDLAQVMKANEK